MASRSVVGAAVACLVLAGCGKGEPRQVDLVVNIKPSPEMQAQLDAQLKRSRVSATQSQVDITASSCLWMFKEDVGRLPTTNEGLQALVSCPPGVDSEKWSGPYTGDEEGEEEIAKDIWGHQLRYRNPGKKKPKWFDLWSVGPDGIDGTDDDIYAKRDWEWENWQRPTTPAAPSRSAR